MARNHNRLKYLESRFRNDSMLENATSADFFCRIIVMLSRRCHDAPTRCAPRIRRRRLRRDHVRVSIAMSTGLVFHHSVDRTCMQMSGAIRIGFADDVNTLNISYHSFSVFFECHVLKLNLKSARGYLQRGSLLLLNHIQIRIKCQLCPS